MDIDQYFKVDQALRDAWVRRETRFNAYTVAYWANLMDSVPEVNKYLLQKVDILTARVEFICPNNHPTASMKFGEEIPRLTVCHVCGEEFHPSLLDSNIVFWFSELPQIEVVKKKVPQLILI